MLQKLLNHKVKIVLVLLFVLLLALIRAYEDTLFYDPFLNYFKSDFNSLPLPEYNSVELFFGLLLRYLVNTLFSLGIIYVLFKDISMVKFASILYVIFFLGLIIAFFLTIYIYQEQNNLLLFYIRRFLIQPIFLLLFLPGFYFQKQISKN
ncbi:exosortase F system-associated membrane protein [Flavobacterium sp.]|uniref:exosortase F system-associated membrane protein n=1 Tax=Flavobacterium sp. TaxID=239 RepID=UPI00286C5441|nr:exosortase F system-associated protein [Flavobacterium sp.]